MTIVFILLVLSVILCLLRFAIGPSISDRMVAVDILTTLLIDSMVILAFIFKEKIFLDVSLALAAVSFVGVIIVGRFIEG